MTTFVESQPNEDRAMLSSHVSTNIVTSESWKHYEVVPIVHTQIKYDTFLVLVIIQAYLLV